MSDLTAERIKQRRKELGLSQEDLALKLNVDRTTVAKWESGNNNLKQSKVKEIAKALNCSPVWLVGLDSGEELILEIERQMENADIKALTRIKAYADYLLSKKEE